VSEHHIIKPLAQPYKTLTTLRGTLQLPFYRCSFVARYSSSYRPRILRILWRNGITTEHRCMQHTECTWVWIVTWFYDKESCNELWQFLYYKIRTPWNYE